MNKDAFREQFWALVERAPRVVVTAHFSPDDDSIGSVLALREIMIQKMPEKEVHIFYSGSVVDRWKAITGFEHIQFVDDVAGELRLDDLLVVLDVSQYKRFTGIPDQIASFENKVCIDHHKSLADLWTLSCIDPSYCSNCELIYAIFNQDITLTKSLAEPLLAGILGDTGNFAYVTPKQSDVFLVAKALVDTLGISIDQFRSQYGAIPVHLVPLLQELYKNTVYSDVDGWPHFQYSFVDRVVMEEGKYSDEDMSAASHIYMGQFLTRVAGYMWGFVITPRRDGSCRISSRSLPGSVNVRVVHEALGIGGGHDRASGGAMQDVSSKQCVEKIVDWMKNNKPVLG